MMSTTTRSLVTVAVWAALSASCAAASSDEPLKPGSPQADQRNAEQLTVAAAGAKQIIAHRGSSADRPENTLASTLRAIEAGATAVEVDVRTTRDGHLVLSHDATLDRTTDGTGPISEKTLEQIRRLDAGSWFDKRYAAERMPTLDEVLAVCRGKIDVLLDLKETGDDYAGRVADVVKKHGEPSRTIVGVRSVEQAELFRKLLPQARRIGLIATPAEIERYAATGVESIRLWPKWLTDDTLVVRVRKAGVGLHLNGETGTPEELSVLLKHRPTSVSGDDPARIVATLKQLRRPVAAVPDYIPADRNEEVE
jgi:glycerophosphoryl diester phosphodiesterase